MLSRRGFFGVLAAPAIVRAASLMPVKALLGFDDVAITASEVIELQTVYMKEFVAMYEQKAALLRGVTLFERTFGPRDYFILEAA